MAGSYPIPFAVGSSSGRSLKNNASELVNMYIHLDAPGGKSKSILLHTPGAEAILSYDYNVVGYYKFKDVLYVVTSKYLYKIVDDIQTTVGAIDITTGPVSFANNGIEMVFVNGNGYAYNPETDTLKNMDTETGWYPSNTVAYMDGYFIFSRTDTGQFFISKLYSTELDPIDWATGEAAPDDTLAVVVVNRQLWIVGERSCEVWYDSGDPLFPFTRIPGAVVDVGTNNYKTVVKALDVMFLVGHDLKVYMTNGYSLTPVSTQAIEYKISQADVSKIRAFAFYERNIWFYALTIDDTETQVYDTQTSLWHRRKSDDIDRWFIEGVYNNFDTAEIIGYSGKQVFLISEDIYTENGGNVSREIVSLPISKDTNRIRIHELEVDMEVGLTTPAELTLQLSSDGGKTWSNKIFSSTGPAGQGFSRARWLRLGQHRNLSAKLVTSSPTPITILSLNVRGG